MGVVGDIWGLSTHKVVKKVGVLGQNSGLKHADLHEVMGFSPALLTVALAQITRAGSGKGCVFKEFLVQF